MVNDLLNQHFPDILSVKFTAQMETELDDIANENRDWVGVVNDFYVPFDKSLEKAERKRLQIEHAPSKSANARKLKLADIIMNIRDITNNPPTWWPLQRILDYFDWAEKVVAGLRGVNKDLEGIFDESLVKANRKYKK